MTDCNADNPSYSETENSTARRNGNPEKHHTREMTHAPTNHFLQPRTQSNPSADQGNSFNQPERHNPTGNSTQKVIGYYTKAQYWRDAVVI